MTNNHWSDDAEHTLPALAQAMQALRPSRVSMNVKSVTGPDNGGLFTARVIEVTREDGSPREEKLLRSQQFGTRRNAEKWLNKQAR